MQNFISSKITNHIDVVSRLLEDSKSQKSIGEIIEAIVKAYNSGKKVMFCGNGGSAADAQHLAAELSGSLYFKRPPLHAEALHANSSFLTAVANDYSYDEVFARAVEAKGNTGDVLVGISTSGNSANVVAAMKKAKEMKIVTVGFTGMKHCEMDFVSKYMVKIPSTDTARIQEGHILVGHIVCEAVEKSLFHESS